MRGQMEIAHMLDQLPKTLQKSVIDGALRAGARVFRDEVRRTAPAQSLRDSVTVKTASRHERARNLLNGDVYVGFKAPHYRLAALFEFGTKPRHQKTTGRYTGQMLAKPYMRPAFAAKGDAAVRKIAETLGRGFERSAKKLASATTAASRKKVFK
jgi:HK97 gp10 family phage protein